MESSPQSTQPAAPATPAVRSPLSASELASIVPASVPVPPPTASYRVGIAAVAATAVLLALVYAALVAGVLFGLFAHVTENTGRIAWGRSEHGIGFRTYAVILVGLATLLVILVRPVFAARPAPDEGIPLPPDREPALHDFVRRVAVAVGAPVPAAIEADDDVNASARLRRGFRSFLGQDLVLRIGTPLLAGLSTAELASVVAHELGHFRQGAGMRLQYVSGTLGSWFARVAFERDAWQDAMRRILWLIPVWVASWLVRKLFHGLVLVLRLVTMLGSRRMELDADAHSLALVGGPVTAAALTEVAVLDAAHTRAIGTVNDEHRHGRLPDDLTALVVAWRGRLTAAQAAEVREAAFAETTHAAATHPCLRERHERALAVPPGPLACERSAMDLLRDPGGLFREATARRYEGALGAEASQVARVESATAMAAEDEHLRARDALRRWAQGAVSYLVLPRVAAWLDEPLPADPPAAAAAARSELLAAAPDARRAIETFDAADTRVVEARRVDAVLGVGGDVKRVEGVTTLGERTAESVRAALAGAAAAQDGARRSIDPALGALARRFAAARALLAAAGHGDAELVAAARELAAGDAVAGPVAELRVTIPSIRDVVREATELKNKRAAQGGLDRLASDLMQRLDAARRAASGGPKGLREAIGPPPPPDAPLGARFDAADAAVGGFYRWWFESAGALALRLEQAERDAGLEPIPAPE